MDNNSFVVVFVFMVWWAGGLVAWWPGATKPPHQKTCLCFWVMVCWFGCLESPGHQSTGPPGQQTIKQKPTHVFWVGGLVTPGHQATRPLSHQATRPPNHKQQQPTTRECLPTPQQQRCCSWCCVVCWYKGLVCLMARCHQATKPKHELCRRPTP